jgi:hypothetical protein
MIVKQDSPIHEFLIWECGSLRTTYGHDIIITKDMLFKTYQNYQQLDRRIAIDVSHMKSDKSLELEDRVDIGNCFIDLRNDGNELWAYDVLFTTEKHEKNASCGAYGAYHSPEFYGLDDDGAPVQLEYATSFDIERISFTDNPATKGAKPIIKLSKASTKEIIKELVRDAHIPEGIDKDKSKKTIILTKDKNMDDNEKLVQALQTLMASLPTIINGIAAGAGVKPTMAPGQDVDNDAVKGVDVDEPGEEKGIEDPSELAAKPEKEAVMDSKDADPEVVVEDEEESEPKEDPKKKFEASPVVNVADSSPLNTTVDDEDKKIAAFVKAKLGKDQDEIAANLLSLELVQDKVSQLEEEIAKIKLSKDSQIETLTSKFTKQIKEANLEIATLSGKISPKALSRVEEFKSLSLDNQATFLSKSKSLFSKVVQPEIKVSTKEDLNVIDCLPPELRINKGNK